MRNALWFVHFVWLCIAIQWVGWTGWFVAIVASGLSLAASQAGMREVFRRYADRAAP